MSSFPVAAYECAFDNQPTNEAEAMLTFGLSGWPVWVHHAQREQHWRVLEVIEPENTPPSPAGLSRYVLLADGPFAFHKGHEGEQYITATLRHITATLRRGRWWITPNTSVNPRRGVPPGD